MPQALAVFLFSSLRWSVHSHSAWVTNWVHFPGFQGMPVDPVRKGHRASRMSTRQSPNACELDHIMLVLAVCTSLHYSNQRAGNQRVENGNCRWVFFCWSTVMNKRSGNYSVLWGFIYVSCVSVFVSMHVRACGCVDSEKSETFLFISLISTNLFKHRFFLINWFLGLPTQYFMHLFYFYWFIYFVDLFLMKNNKTKHFI